MRLNYKELFSWDLLGMVGYAIGQALLFVLWLSVAYAIMSSYEILISKDSYYIAAFLGGIGTYWYSIRKYEGVIEK